MKVFLCVCLFVSLSLVASQRLGNVAPVEPQEPEREGGEPLRPVVAARPVQEDEMSAMIAECNRRIGINASIAHYVQVPSDCSVFAACEFPDSDVQPVMVLCPAGLFFNDDMDVMACVRPIDANCRDSPGNPCAGKPDGYNQDGVRSQITQGAYYECQNGQTVSGGWCDLGEQYLMFTQACLPIPDRPKPRQPVREPVPCHLRPAASDSSSFLLGDSEMSCPGNTQFNPVSCACE